MNKITQRVQSLRGLMQRENLQAYYIPGTGPHISEYLPACWKTREFISGFTGSFGEVVITERNAILWTDSRYFIQAGEELAGSGFEMFKLRVADAKPFDDWLIENFPRGSRVGVYPHHISVNTHKNLLNKLSASGIELVLTPDLLDEVWEGRPKLPDNEVFELEKKYAGVSRVDKLDKISQIINQQGADIQVVAALDDLAWAFNLRGSDIEYNPVFIGYGVIGSDIKALFVEKKKLPVTLSEKMEREGIKIYGYDELTGFLKGLKDQKILIDPQLTNVAICEACSVNNKVVEKQSVPLALKAVKNNVELEGFREAMQKDGVALVEFLYWLRQNLGKEAITEYIVGKKLKQFRAAQEGFVGESFPPIVGYKSHGAIVHLSVDEASAFKIGPEGLLLFDSGGHYLHGTTDITRTIALGGLTGQQKRDFTLVLKGMIALSEAKFPYGTKGCHLDILARKALWSHGLNYGHGTGHGVGHFLSVHEGPMSIRQDYNEHPIVPGMVVSNEPGLYRTGEYGIRIENILLCIEKEDTGFGRFLGFETLTLCPIDTTAIDTKLLSRQEKNWVNNYHKVVRGKLKNLLSDELNLFLAGITKDVE
ncbi:MAG: aminopeptidase P family protein [Chlorobi bacterium]|nr:aminopeptidase P family protein [Chlorobiota bacterium]